MILDTSAIVAILLVEPGSAQLRAKIEDSGFPGVGTPTLTEAGVVLADRIGSGWGQALERFLEELAIGIIPFGEQHWQEAVVAYRRFGKGWHPAGLNFGDCFSYAVARIAGRPLLCTGNDFTKTDLELA